MDLDLREVFNQKRSCRTDKVRLRELSNIFLSHEGLVLKNLILPLKSQFNLIGNEDKTFYFSFWKLALEQYFVSTYGKSLIKETLDKDLYLVIHNKWFGYFFWITDCIPKLLVSQSQHDNLILIYPEKWSRFNFVNETLSEFENLRTTVVKDGHHLQIKKAIIPTTRPWSNCVHPEDLQNVKEFFLEIIERKNITNLVPNNRIYISRSKANRRKILNEDELTDFLEREGFSSVNLEDYNIFEQAAIINNADIIIGTHGAGLANMVFLDKKKIVIELAPKVNQKDLRISFWRMAGVLDLKYSVVFCDHQNENVPDVYDNDIVVPIRKLELILTNISTNN